MDVETSGKIGRVAIGHDHTHRLDVFLGGTSGVQGGGAAFGTCCA